MTSYFPLETHTVLWDSGKSTGLRAQTWEELTQTWEEAFTPEHVLGQSALDPISQHHFNLCMKEAKFFIFLGLGDIKIIYN